MQLPYGKKLDAWIALTVFGLVLFGIVMIYSASANQGYTLFLDDKHFVKRQIIWAILGFIGLAVMTNIDYHFWKKWAGWMLGITFFLLISVFFLSKGEINGAHRWIVLAGQTFQPSELAKLTFIIYLSAWLVQRQEQIGSILETFLPYLLVLVAISFLMLRQPDFGTLAIILVSAIAIYFVAGLTWKQVVIGVTVLVIAVASISLGSSYRRDRLKTFLNPGQDQGGISYHTENIAIAIGSGGIQGLGFGKSKQKNRFLPEPHTDSIFAVITEELGFIGAEILLLVFAFLIYRGYRIASFAPDLFGRLLGVGITTWFAFQAFINLGSMVHVVPLVGVPLPFVSYGGTNLVISLIAIGLLLNISRYNVGEENSAGKPKPRLSKKTYES